MIDLTPLDVRKKRGDFRRSLRGYDPDEVDQFLEMAAERMEELVRENNELTRKADALAQRVEASEGKEKAVQEALVTAQEMREEMRGQARKEAELIRREAEEEARRIAERTERLLDERRRELRELNRARERFLRSLRGLLEREMDALEVEESRIPEDDFGGMPSGSRTTAGEDHEVAAQETGTEPEQDPGVEAVPFTYDDDDEEREG